MSEGCTHPFLLTSKWPPAILVKIYRYKGIQYSKMSSATDFLDTPHSDSDSERTLTASFPDYGDPISARSPDATLLAGTRRTATPATGGELFSDAPQRPPGATILANTRITAVPANDDELLYNKTCDIRTEIKISIEVGCAVRYLETK